MASTKSFEDKIASEQKSIGFDYQYYYFLLQLLSIRHGQKIGLEVKDDVHIDMPNGKTIRIQLKHSIQRNAKGEIINLTERNIDLWKTIHNWINVTKDPVESRKGGKAQIEFLKNTELVLVTNKSENSQNDFLAKLAKFKNDGDLDSFKTYLNKLYNSTEKSTDELGVKDYINELSIQSDKFLCEFLTKIKFELNVDDIISMIKEKLHEFMLQDNKIDDVFHCLDSSLRSNIYFDVKYDKKIELTYEDYRKKYRLCFDKGRTEKLPIRKYEHGVPSNPEKQIFVKQLIEIGHISNYDDDKIIEYSRYKLHAFNNIEAWLQEGELSEEQVSQFRKNCILKWQVQFDKAYREIKNKLKKGLEVSEDDIINASLACLDEIRAMELKFDANDFDLEMSNGKYYLLSDEPVIGWHINWEKYKK